MLMLALELSASPCSAAVLRDGVIAAESQWESGGRHNQRVFEVLPAIFKAAGCAPADMDLFAMGTGPGAFSALRIAAAALAGLAAPDGRPVIGVPSTEALALDLWLARRESPVLIIGDARRSRYWRALYAGIDNTVRCVLPPALCGPEDLAQLLPAGGIVASPDWSRIAASLPALIPPPARLLEENSVPRAWAIAPLAAARFALGPPWPPAIPLYLTPSTNVPPRPAA
jgi:tRNA threonylcarbamoyladenosine biosynthesis protein TsaB